jgi:hypothetical protein
MAMRSSFTRARVGGLALAVVLGVATITARPLLRPTVAQRVIENPTEHELFERILSKYQDFTFDQFQAALSKRTPPAATVSFDPTQVKFFDRVRTKLKMTAEELALYKRSGFVSIDQKRRHSFASGYYYIYASDLPVLITTDSILHALHLSYDAILAELEASVFTTTADEILRSCHKELARRGCSSGNPVLDQSCHDVDLFLTVARNLLAGAGAPAEGTGGIATIDRWDGELLIRPAFGQDSEILARLRDIQSGLMQVPLQDSPTSIYGGSRFLDYSQFRPRGHYTKSLELERFFRCMTWMGRADCGWHILQTRLAPGIEADCDRELRDAALLCQLIQATGQLGHLRAINDLLSFLVGRSDNLGVFALVNLLNEHKITAVKDLADDISLGRLKRALENGNLADQMIRSQAIVSDPQYPFKVHPPSSFLVFGQRFTIDSFILSHMVFDSIVFKGRKQERMMPSGLDLMAALGNDEAITLVSDEVRRWKYGANLLASRDFTRQLDPRFWRQTVSNIWLDAIRTLDDDVSSVKNVPESMRTAAWQRKQLRTQLASWAELRHDNLLYGKPSYIGVPACEYPAGYVEPYPRFFSTLRSFAETALKHLGVAHDFSRDPNRNKQFRYVKAKQTDYFRRLARILESLEVVARKELNAEPLTAEEQGFIQRTIDRRGSVRWGSGSRPRYDGWYCDLLYDTIQDSMYDERDIRSVDWGPTIVDVHTDPNSRSVLEAAVGDVNLAVIAIDNRGARAVYVGPIFSYYEFRHPAEDRLTDQRWAAMLVQDHIPAPPDWTKEFQAPAAARTGD